MIQGRQYVDKCFMTSAIRLDDMTLAVHTRAKSTGSTTIYTPVRPASAHVVSESTYV